MNLYTLIELLRKKWLLVGIFGIVIIVILVLLFLPSSPKQEENLPESTREIQSTIPQTQPTVIPKFNIDSSPNNIETLQDAIDEAKNASKEYDDWQASLRADYPWLRKLPIASEKYFVYFDLNKNVFIGRLYPKGGDNVEQMKADILEQLKTAKEVPVESYQFEWLVSY